MKTRSLLQGLALPAVLLSLACSNQGPRVLLPARRILEEGRELKVLVKQTQINGVSKTSNPGVANVLGGLPAVLITVGLNASRANEAEENVQPVRLALTGFDFDAEACRQARAGLERLAWFNLKESSSSKDVSDRSYLALLNGARHPQVLFAEYAYALSQDCSELHVHLSTKLAERNTWHAAEFQESIYRDQLIFGQTFTYVVPLESPDAVFPAENAKRWAAEGGKRIHAALGQALTGLPRLLAHSLEQTEVDIKASKRGKFMAFQDHAGLVMEQTAEGILMRPDWDQDRWLFIAPRMK